MKFSKGSAAIIAVIIVVVLLIVAGGIWYYIANKPIACTQEAKVCPDGTSVGRTGKNCEFAECPIVSGCKNLYWFDNVHTTCQEPEQFCGAYMRQYLQTFETKTECETTLATKDWKTYTNNTYGFEFKYPNDWALSTFKAGDPSALLSVELSGGDNKGFVFVYQYSNITLEDDKRYFNNLANTEPEAKVELNEFNINGNPALKINYIHRVLSESTGKWTETPTVILKTHNNYFYSFDCSLDRYKCDQILSTFKFTN